MNGYKEAIAVLKTSDGRNKDLLWEIAKISPSSLVKAAKSIGIIPLVYKIYQGEVV